MIKAGYLLLGPELGEKKQFIDDLTGQIRKQYGDSAEEYSYYPYDIQMPQIISIAESISMFSSFKIIIINDVCELKKKDTDLLAGYFASPAPDTVFILTDEGMKVDAKLKKAVPEEKIFWELKEGQIRSYVENYFRRRRIPIDSEAAAFIAGNCEANTLAAKNECDKLAVYFQGKDCITLEAIEDFLFYSKEESVFTLFDYILTGNMERAMEGAKQLMLSGDGAPIQLLGGLIWQFRRFRDFRLMTEEYGSMQEAFTACGVRTKKGQGTYSAGSRNYTAEDMERILSLCAFYDELFRSIRTEMQESYFLIFLYEVMVKKGRRHS